MGPLVAHAAAGGARLRGRGAAAAGAVGAAGVPRGLAARVRGHLLDDGVVLLELVADAHNHQLLEHLQPSVAVRSSAARLASLSIDAGASCGRRRRRLGWLRPPARSAGLAVAVGRWRLSWPRPAATKRAGLATTIEMAAATGEAPGASARRRRHLGLAAATSKAHGAAADDARPPPRSLVL
ncbi:hypothetical protein PVAP13_3KG001500 [Panicum virgatum]|uniref:Uncharacterized protein n=1 Tax=Panicum virgatum TaxID=38727 RepID=A0A8T0UKD0_PANVG|nr:hypothetical protein PVAP13_3KG001500 [Panicum virgatum]